MHPENRQGFTLFELSIVLVIIGLIVGGVFVGKELIDAAAVRAQISQIQRYQLAMNTFRVKYNCLPGDCANAGALGFAARDPHAGEGDGDGVIVGVRCHGTCAGPWYQNGGETVMLWVDLSAAHFISDNLNTATSDDPTDSVAASDIGNYLPLAKLGNGNYVVASSGWDPSTYQLNGINVFGTGHFGQMTNGIAPPYNGLSVSQAFSIDSKLDDGLPQSGKVIAQVMEVWSAGGGETGAEPGDAVSPTTATCYDNGNDASLPMAYTMANGGQDINCAIELPMN